ncbi:MAG: restriction endonuclease subunit S [Bacteroidales bacterium]|nr:restriction endonuclease subunit S [Bacteroidales bacterium]
MNNDRNIGLVPEIRFPEFCGDWIQKSLGESFEERTEKNRSDLPLLSLGEEGLVYQSETARKDNSNADKSKYLRVAVGDIAYNTMRMWQGRCVCAGIEGIVSPAYTVCKPKEGVDSLFHYYLFKTQRMIHIFHQNSQGLVSDTLNLKYDSFSKIKYLIPPTLAEQEKIAKCLLEADEIISEQEKKVESLKIHKKGLMQQLFPQPGTTTPALRFPGFTGKWQEKPLRALATKVNRKNKDLAITRVLTNSATEGVVDQHAYFERDIVVRDNTNNYYIVEIGEFVYNPRISSSAPVGPISINKVGKGIMSPLYTVFKFHQGDTAFFEQYFQTEIWHSYLKSIANFGARFDRMNITTEGFFNMPLFVPSIEEQKKIAACLESLDKLIAAETKKRDSLKNHKKGLMQQLFPQHIK